MGIFLVLVLPTAWALTGRLLEPAVRLSVPTEAGRRVAASLGRWCSWVLPSLYCLLLFLAAEGDAGHGIRVFGSEGLFAVMCLSIYLTPALALYIGLLYVVRDLVRGLRSRES